jgi:aminoglycoside phosphotransferase (APT) family kinase protein
MQEPMKVTISWFVSARRAANSWPTRALFPSPANADSAKDVGAVLLDYFQTRLGLSSLAFANAPTAFTDGLETYCYRFQLMSSDPLPPVFGQPLIVRIYSGLAGLPRAQQEIRVQLHMHQLKYPVAEPLFLEENCAYLGGPFLVMAQVYGQSLLRALLHRPWQLLSAPARMAETQVRLHQLPADGFPSPPGCLLTRRLEEMAGIIQAYGLCGLQPGMDWLIVHQPAPPQDPRILHLDFHPLNLIEDRNRGLVVLDWNMAELGDPHADVGTTLMLMECQPPIDVKPLDRLAVGLGRPLFLPLYLRTYRRHCALEDDKLAYYRAWAGFDRLCKYGLWLQDGPQMSGDKPAMLKCITDAHRHKLERYFRKWTGVSVRL